MPRQEEFRQSRASSPLLLPRRAAAALEDRLELAVHVLIARGLDGGGVAVAERVLARGGRGRVAVDDLAARRAERDGDLARAAVRGALRRLRANRPVTYSFPAIVRPLDNAIISRCNI